ncbi:MAG: GDP-mannose 4,6-dehydratase [candidate division KSB1 bacterium]|nr:GDP-mannose 4,6-dehydratase [candidate division KSB1 bacterium]
MGRDNRVSRIAVFGGAGFVGNALVARLLEAGATVGVFDNFSTGRREFLDESHPRLTVVEGDMAVPAEVDRFMGDFRPGVVVILAAVHYIPLCNRDPVLAMRTNVLGTHYVLTASARTGVRRIVFASSAAVYGIGDAPHSEEEEPAPTDVYGMTKLIGEQLTRQAAQTYRYSAVIARLFNIYGPRETNPHVIPEIVSQALVGNRLKLGNLEPKRDYIHVSDVAEALALLVDCTLDTVCEVFNVGTGREYSVKELVEMAERILGRHLEIEQDPSRTRRSDRLHLCANINKIQRWVGWRPRVRLEEGLRRLLLEEWAEAVPCAAS